MKKTILSIILIIIVVVGLVWVLRQPVSPENSTQTIEQEIPQELTVAIIREGQGEVVLGAGSIAVVHYEGFLVDGTLFDSSVERGTPFEFPFGQGQVIAGWEMGLDGMKVGEQRQIVVPPEFGYGEREVGPIPANSTLIFNVELLEIK